MSLALSHTPFRSLALGIELGVELASGPGLLECSHQVSNEVASGAVLRAGTLLSLAHFSAYLSAQHTLLTLHLQP